MAWLDNYLSQFGGQSQEWNPQNYLANAGQAALAPAAPPPPPQMLSDFTPATAQLPTMPQPAPIAPPPTGKKVKVDPYMQQLQESEAAKARAIDAQVLNEKAQNDYRAAETAKAAAAKANEERAIQEHRTLIDQDLDLRQQDIAQRAHAAALETPDPGRWWRDSSTGTKVGTLVYAALSGFLNPTTGGPKQAMDTIQGIVNRDINLQMTAIEGKREGIKGEQAQVNQGYARNAAEADARLAAVLRSAQAVSTQIDAEASRFNSPIVDARAQQMKADIQANIAKEMQDHRDKQTQLGLQGATVALQKRAQDLGWAEKQMDTSLSIYKTAEAAKAMAAKGSPEDRKTLIPGLKQPDGTPFHALSDTEAEKIRKQMAGVADIDQMIAKRAELRQQLDAARAKTQGMPMDAKAFAQADYARRQLGNLDASLLASIKDARGFTRWSEGEKDLFTQMIGSPIVGDPQIVARANQMLRDTLHSLIENDLRSNGYTGPSPFQTTQTPSFADFGGTNTPVVAPPGLTENATPRALQRGYPTVAPPPPAPPLSPTDAQDAYLRGLRGPYGP